MKIKIFFISALFMFTFYLTPDSTLKNNIKLTALSGMERIGQSQEPYGDYDVKIKAAKNEIESFQVVISALGENIKVMNIEVSHLIGENGSIIDRDSTEDYDYFAILEKLAGKETVNRIVDTIAPNWWSFSKSPKEILSAREKLADEIQKASK